MQGINENNINLQAIINKMHEEGIGVNGNYATRCIDIYKHIYGVNNANDVIMMDRLSTQMTNIDKTLFDDISDISDSNAEELSQLFRVDATAHSLQILLEDYAHDIYDLLLSLSKFCEQTKPRLKRVIKYCILYTCAAACIKVFCSNYSESVVKLLTTLSTTFWAGAITVEGIYIGIYLNTFLKDLNKVYSNFKKYLRNILLIKHMIDAIEIDKAVDKIELLPDNI